MPRGHVRATLTAFLLWAALDPEAARAGAGAGPAPPIDVVWVIRAGPISVADPIRSIHQELSFLVGLARRVGARPLLLVSGDVAEEILARRLTRPVRSLLASGGEVGVYVPLVARQGLRAWSPRGGTGRVGSGMYDPVVTRALFADHVRWARQLAPRPPIAFESESALPSDESAAATGHGLELAVGSRLGFGPLTLGHNVPVAWRPGRSDLPGEELGWDGASALVAVDRGGQVGDWNAEGLDGTVLSYIRAFDHLADERKEARPLPWVLVFLTEASGRRRPLRCEVERWVRRVAARTKGGQGRPRAARWATASGVLTGFRAWEAAHPGVASFAHVHRGEPPPPAALAIRRAQQDLLVRVRSGIGRVRTGRDNLEERWCAIQIWRAVLESTRPEALARAVTGPELEDLCPRLLAPSGATFVLVDDLLSRLEAVARSSSRPSIGPPGRRF